ncbi:MAG: hypothetical protein ACKOXB_03195 [Flavobacteriales bacterium]
MYMEIAMAGTLDSKEYGTTTFFNERLSSESNTDKGNHQYLTQKKTSKNWKP